MGEWREDKEQEDYYGDGHLHLKILLDYKGKICCTSTEGLVLTVRLSGIICTCDTLHGLHAQLWADITRCINRKHKRKLNTIKMFEDNGTYAQLNFIILTEISGLVLT